MRMMELWAFLAEKSRGDLTIADAFMAVMALYEKSVLLFGSG
ncbi:hypothetical protein [Halomonas cupida]|nr:hypothetical protein [Halomonas cupida]